MIGESERSRVERKIEEPPHVKAPAGERVAAAEPVDALLVIHGMGEQLRFTALNDVAEGLQRTGAVVEPFTVQTVMDADGKPLQRLKVKLHKNENDKPRELHIYEAYWAPITEGEAKVSDTVWFLLRGGWNGAKRMFDLKWWRWLFGDDRKFWIPFSTPIELLVATATILGLVLLNAIALTVAAAAGSVPFFTAILKKYPHLLPNVSTTLGFVALQVSFLAVLLLLAFIVQKIPGARRIVSVLAFGAFYASLATIALCVVLVPVEINFHAGQNAIDTMLTSLGIGRGIATFWLVAAVVAVFLVFEFLRRWSPESRLGSVVQRTLLVSAVAALIPGLCLAVLSVVAALSRSFGQAVGRCESLYIRLWLEGPPVHPALGLIVDGRLLIALWIFALALAFIPTKKRGTLTFFSVTLSGLAAFGTAYRVGFWIGSRIPCLRRDDCEPHCVFGDWVAVILPWFAVLAVSYFVKWFLAQYLGDVAAYVASNRLDRFFEIRRKILDISLNVAQTIYSSTEPAYQRIGFMGHSLGSVIAYDTINRMMLNDDLQSGKSRVVERTNFFLTFGSPLDKTAYVFSTSSGKDDPTRDALAASTQPLIRDERYRKSLQWVNVWSPNDIISGPLKFYDLPENPAHPVENKEDPEASIPLAAHVAYWDNQLIFNVIREWVVGK